jgi:hypothetical protein
MLKILAFKSSLASKIDFIRKRPVKVVYPDLIKSGILRFHGNSSASFVEL